MQYEGSKSKMGELFEMRNLIRDKSSWLKSDLSVDITKVNKLGCFECTVSLITVKSIGLRMRREGGDPPPQAQVRNEKKRPG